MVSKTVSLYKKLKEDDIWGASASLAYYLLLSFFPFVIALVSLLSFVPVGTNELLALLEDFLPQNVFELIRENTWFLVNGKTSVLSIGFITALWIASKSTKALVRSLNVSYDTRDSRPWWLRYIIALLMTLFLAAVIIVSAVLFLFGIQLLTAFDAPANIIEMAENLRSVVLYAILVLVMAFIFKFAPNRKLKLKWVIPGALCTGVIWVVATVAFGIYLGSSDIFADFYGTLGGVIAMLLWLYLISFSILFGNALNAFRLDYYKNK